MKQMDLFKSKNEAELQRPGRDKSTAVNSAYINGGSFRKKFDHITDSAIVNREIFKRAKEILMHRSGTKTEDIYWLDSKTGNVVARVINQPLSVESSIEYTDTVSKEIAKHDGLIALHNHPNSMPPSVDDFIALP